MDLGLSGARVLVTGASRGIGRAIAGVFAQEGAGLALCARDGVALAEAAGELSAGGARVFARPLDVRDHEALPGFVADAVAALGGLDVLVSNVSGGGGATPAQGEGVVTPHPVSFLLPPPAAEPPPGASSPGGG
ncbi:SDR family NAD(P)-dependent oxidoreductase, partial [Nocardiopsis flavescens]|uniref:SDR family NAD(P)-dependent oxidoreductase n=1 Tax=Nocardiopsis flavescens TaxID=758803 RepID=UPI0036DB911D